MQFRVIWGQATGTSRYEREPSPRRTGQSLSRLPDDAFARIDPPGVHQNHPGQTGAVWMDHLVGALRRTG